MSMRGSQITLTPGNDVYMGGAHHFSGRHPVVQAVYCMPGSRSAGNPRAVWAKLPEGRLFVCIGFLDVRRHVCTGWHVGNEQHMHPRKAAVCSFSIHLHPRSSEQNGFHTAVTKSEWLSKAYPSHTDSNNAKGAQLHAKNIRMNTSGA